MDRFDRIYKLHQILSARRTPASRRVLEERMDYLRATVARAIECLRNFLDAPIEYDHQRNGYYYANRETGPYEQQGPNR